MVDRKLIKKLSAVVLSTAVLMISSGCGSGEIYTIAPTIPTKTEAQYGIGPGIYRLDFLGASEPGNSCYFDLRDKATWSRVYDHALDVSLLDGEYAYELIQEVESIDDSAYSEGPFAYRIAIDYLDDDLVEHSVYRCGYGAFPDNWKKIVDLVNGYTEKSVQVSYGTDVLEINGEYVREHYGYTDDMLPRGMTVEDYLEEQNITYDAIYGGPKNRRDENVSLAADTLRRYTYDVFGLDAYSYKKYADDVVRSSQDELMDFAERYLDVLYDDEIEDYCIAGEFEEKPFCIVRLDHMDDWLEANDDAQSITVSSYDMEAFMYEDYYSFSVDYPYIEKSRRFVILTPEEDFNYIHDFMERVEKGE